MSDVLLVQNTRIEGSGYLGELLEQDGFQITSVNAKHEKLPDKNYSCKDCVLNNMSESNRANPLYPIDVDDYPKLFDYVLTKTGLQYFHYLKRHYVLGKEMTQDEYNQLRLLYVYYATANRNSKEVSAWQDLCVTLDEKGILEVNQSDFIISEL